MFVDKKIPTTLVLKLSYKRSVIYLLWASLITWIEMKGVFTVKVDFLPFSSLGVAVALFLGFRNNSSYDRFWEGRKIWGGVVNTSRALTCFLLSKDIAKDKIQKLVLNHIDYLKSLVDHLRGFKNNLGEPQIDRESLVATTNKPNGILLEQYKLVDDLFKQDGIDGFDKKKAYEYLDLFYDYQGKSERIKKTPLPRQYTYFTKIFTYIYLIFLPFGMIEKLEWLTIFFAFLIFWIFTAAEKIGAMTEDPFDGGINDVPIATITRAIEIDLKQLIEFNEIPQPLVAEDGVLK